MDRRASANSDGGSVTAKMIVAPRAQHRPRVLAQRCTAFLASLTDHSDMRAEAKLQVLGPKASELRQTQSGLNSQQYQRMVATA